MTSEGVLSTSSLRVSVVQRGPTPAAGMGINRGMQ